MSSGRSRRTTPGKDPTAHGSCQDGPAPPAEPFRSLLERLIGCAGWPLRRQPMSSRPGANRADVCCGPGGLVWLFVLAETVALAVTVAVHYRAEVGVAPMALPPGSCRPGPGVRAAARGPAGRGIGSRRLRASGGRRRRMPCESGWQHRVLVVPGEILLRLKAPAPAEAPARVSFRFG